MKGRKEKKVGTGGEKTGNLRGGKMGGKGRATCCLKRSGLIIM